VHNEVISIDKFLRNHGRNRKPNSGNLRSINS